MDRSEKLLLVFAVGVMLAYFIMATPVMMDDGEHYEGFTESLARGVVDFESFYGFQGLSILSVFIFWLTGSHISIIITSTILYLLSLPLAYFIGRDFYANKRAGIYFMLLVILMPYVYTTMLRGFQEAALLFFVLLTIYGAINKKPWTPISWAYGGIVKPFSLVLFPLFSKDLFILRFNLNIWAVNMVIALTIGGLYLGVSYYQTGHLINNAAINSYEGSFDPGNPPPLGESFILDWKGFARVGANLLLHYRKILLSPLAVIIGVLVLWRGKNFRLRKEIILAILLNIVLVGSLTFSFSKYLLPMIVLLALASISYLLKYRWLIFLVIIDSYFIFAPLWNYYQTTFWNNRLIYYLPLYLSVFIILFLWKEKASS